MSDNEKIRKKHEARSDAESALCVFIDAARAADYSDDDIVGEIADIVSDASSGSMKVEPV